MSKELLRASTTSGPCGACPPACIRRQNGRKITPGAHTSYLCCSPLVGHEAHDGGLLLLHQALAPGR
eukprot:4881759-Pyramimonas_sp.AAC.1